MDNFKVIEIKKSVFENNDREADKLREELKALELFCFFDDPVDVGNLIPGSSAFSKSS